MAALLGAVLVGVVGLVERVVARADGGAPDERGCSQLRRARRWPRCAGARRRRGRARRRLALAWRIPSHWRSASRPAGRRAVLAPRRGAALVGARSSACCCGVAGHAAAARRIAGIGAQALGLWLFVAGWLAGLARASMRWRACRQRGVVGAGRPGAVRRWRCSISGKCSCVGFGVPQVLLPPPSADRPPARRPRCRCSGADFRQTFLKAVLAGYVIGCGAGFLVADPRRPLPFLQRGLLPLGNFVSALPIVGIAPIMVMWFGFDWQSKAAVVVVMTFFPMLVNTRRRPRRRRRHGARPDAHLRRRATGRRCSSCACRPRCRSSSMRSRSTRRWR